jgi:regulator of sirC expression with transglutaminase-like and TPR domain
MPENVSSETQAICLGIHLRLLTMYHTEVNALISLIEDPDENIYRQVKSEIIGYGERIIPQLEQYWELSDLGPLFHERIEELISSIQYDGVYTRLKNWKESGADDLLEGALIINRYQYPGYDEDELRDKVSRIRQEIWLELNDNLTALEAVNVMNHMLFKVHGFHGNRDNYHQPQNSYLADLISSKKGNPLSLGILYAHLANTLDLPIYGVNLPSHFILCYLDDTIKLLMELKGEELNYKPTDAPVLFYINPFNEGAILHFEEVEAFLNKQQLPLDQRFFGPCEHTDMIARMINNLIHSYVAANRDDKVRELRAMLSLLLEK